MEAIPASAHADICELVQCCLAYLTIEVSRVCCVQYPQRSFRRHISNRHNATFDQEIPLLGASVLVVAESYRLGNSPDMLPNLFIFLLRCQVTVSLPSPHGFCCPMENSNTGVHGSDSDL
jgi:hypothetical protein